jgi:diguanylate cyclase
MKKVNFFGLYDNSLAGLISTQLCFLFEEGRKIGGEQSQLEQAQAEIYNLKGALIKSQNDLKNYQTQHESHLQTIDGLRQKLSTLTKQFAHVRYFALHDELTGLSNRSLLQDRLKQALALSDRQQKPVALLFIDLDKFKSVNDTLGHDVGDQLLQEVAARLSDSIRCGDTACRYGGDEFLILLTEIEGEAGVISVMEKIQARLSIPYLLEGHTVSISASIGTVIYENDGQNYTDLIKQADSAMYRAKINKVF